MWLFVYQEDTKEYKDTLQKSFTIESVPFDKRLSIQPNSKVFLMLDDENFLAFVQKFSDLSCQIYILPFAKNPLQQKAFNIPSNFDEALQRYQEEKIAYTNTLLRCNEMTSIGCVTIGKSDVIQKDLLSFLKALLSLHLLPLKITTKEDQEFKSAALFIEAGNEALMTKKRLSFFKTSDNQCKRIAAIIYAPKSLLQALRLKFLPKNQENQPLPEGIGVIKSAKLLITSLDGQALDLHINGKLVSTKNVELESKEMAMQIATTFSCVSAEETKESIRIQKLPTNEELINFYTKKHLPLLPIAAEEDFAELFTKLRQNAKMSVAYTVLLIISVLMATTGLFQNSAPTIIGAMILAPLMGPIISLAMAAVRFDATLLRQSLKSVVLSTLLALLLSASFAALLSLRHITEQMAMRTHPTLLDLAVAILAGIAAAYGHANSKVGESLAGVAIAVALVPPLCVAGIGIGWMQPNLFFGSILLFLANVIGIIFAAGMVFYLLGFASQKYVAAAFFIKTIMVAFIIIPLWLSTRTFLTEENLYSKIALLNKNIDSTTIQIEKITLQGNHMEVYVDIFASKRLSPTTKQALIKKIKKFVPPHTTIIVSNKERY